MTEQKKTENDDSADLRRRAVEMVRKRAEASPPDGVDSQKLPPKPQDPISLEETRRVLHELRVHQIELEMQNEELRRTQAELDVARARYFDLYDLAPVGYCVLSEKGLILEANLTVATLLGVPRSALAKKPITRFILSEDQDIFFRQRKELFATGAPQVCELRMLRREGSPFMARVEAVASQDADGAPVCRAVVSDITAHHVIKTAFRRKEKDVREKNAVSPDSQILAAMSQNDPPIILLLEDDPAHAEAVQRAFLDSGMKAAVHWARNLRDFRALTDSHLPDIAIVDLHLPDGSAVDVLTSTAEAGLFPILIMTGYGDERVAVEAIKAGAIDYLEKSSEAFAALPHAVVRSLREWNLLQAHKRTEETLRRTEENFRRSLDDSPLGVRVVTAAGETLYANREILEFYGYDSIEEFDRRPIQERFTPQSYAEFLIRKNAREQGEFGPREYKIGIVRKNGEFRRLQIFRKEIIWNGEKQFQALYRDVTEEEKRGEAVKKFEATIKGQEMLIDRQSSSVEELIDRLTRSRADLGASYEALKANKNDLVRSEKLAFTGQIAASIAHEIRNPLTNIILSLRQLKKSDGINSEGLAYAGIMERNSNRIEYLISELLNCARPIKLNLQPGNVHRILTDVLAVHKVRLITQKIRVRKNLTSHPPILLVDKEYLGRVFLNLTANAIEAMASGGVLSIATKIEKSAFIVKVQDNGKGIPEKNLIKIFDPFFSTKKRGVGLGLTTCQNIVTSHGGRLEVESAWGKGTIFIVSLPFDPASSADDKTSKKRQDGEVVS